MTDDTHTKDVLATGAARTSISSVTLVVGALLAISLAVAFGNPFIVLALVGASALAALSLWRPVWMLWGSLFTLLVVPTYVRLPTIAGLPPLPVSLAFLGVLLGTLALTAALGRRAAPCGPRGRRFVAACGIFGGVLLLSLIDARTTIASFDFWIKVFVVPWLMGYAMLRLVHDANDIERLFRVVLAGAIVAVAFAVGEYASGTNVLHELFLRQGDESEWYWRGEDFARWGSVHRVYSLFTNPIEFGALMSMIYPYALLRASFSPTRAGQIGWAGVTLALLGGAMLSFSRGPILAIVVTALALACLVRPARKFVAAGVLVAVLGLAVIWPFIGHLVEERVRDIDNVTLRLKLFTIAWHMALDHPVIGVGFANFPYYQDETIRSNRINTLVEPNAERIHTSENMYLQLAAETGILGFAAFGVLLIAYSALVVWLYRRAASIRLRTFVLASATAVVAYLLNGLTVVSYQQYVMTLVAGFALAVPLLVERLLRNPP